MPIMKKQKPEKCRQCKGSGILVDHINGELSSDEKKIITSNIAYTLCHRCRGVGIVGIPELEDLSPQQLRNLVKGKSFEELFNLLTNKSHEELVSTLRSIPTTEID